LVVFDGFQNPPDVHRVVLNQLLNRISIRPENDDFNVGMCVGDLKRGTRLLHTKNLHFPLHVSPWGRHASNWAMLRLHGHLVKNIHDVQSGPQFIFALGVEHVHNPWQGMSVLDGRII